MSHTESINQLAEGYQFYKARREEYGNGEQNINFRVAPQPLRLQERERRHFELGSNYCTIFGSHSGALYHRRKSK